MIIKTSEINPRYEFCDFSDMMKVKKFIRSPEIIPPGLDLTTNARGTDIYPAVQITPRSLYTLEPLASGPSGLHASSSRSKL